MNAFILEPDTRIYPNITGGLQTEPKPSLKSLHKPPKLGSRDMKCPYMLELVYSIESIWTQVIFIGIYPCSHLG